MIKSIQQFEENGIGNIKKVIENFVVNPKNHADFIYGITENVIQLGLNMIAETLSDMDEELRNSQFRKLKWSIVKKDQTTLLTELQVLLIIKEEPLNMRMTNLEIVFH